MYRWTASSVTRDTSNLYCVLSPAHTGFSGVPSTELTNTCTFSKSSSAYGMYLPDVRPWVVGMPLKPPPDVCGREPFMKGAACRCDEFGRMEPAMLSAFPVESGDCGCWELKAFRCCSGKAKPWPSCRVTTRMPGLGGLTTGAWVRASDAAFRPSARRLRGNGELESGRRGDGEGTVSGAHTYIIDGC